MTPLELILSKLPRAKRNGKGWAARCPAHDDKRPSLSIAEGEGGRVLLHCHAGCPAKAVVAALGLSLRDLMPDSPMTKKSPAVTPGKEKSNAMTLYTTSDAAVVALEKTHGPRAAVWTYHGASGEPVGAVVRWNTVTGKTIRPFAKVQGGWVIGAMPEPRTLYQLLALLARPGEPVYVAEGEKCADALAGLGMLATTSAGGANTAGKSDWSPLAGRTVVIVPDCDKAGEKYAADVSAALASLTPPAKVRLIDLREAWPDLGEGGDIADIADGEEAESVRGKLAGLVEAESEPATDKSYRPFPLAGFPDVLRRLIEEGADSIGVDPAFIALPLLSAMGAAIGNSRRIAVKEDWVQPANIWTALVASSGSAKSPAQMLALDALHQRQAAVWAGHKQAMDDHADAMKVWKANGKDGEEPAAPAPCEHFYLADTTVEAIAVRLESNPRGLVVAVDELAAFFKGMNQYKSGGSDRESYLSFYDAGPAKIDRKSSVPPTIFIPRAFVAVTGGIQPGILRELMTDDAFDSGLAARFLFANPPEQPPAWREKTVGAGTLAAVANIFSALWNQWMGETVVVPLTDAARERFAAFVNEMGMEQMAFESDAMKATWAKLRGVAARIALVLHCAHVAAQTPGVMAEAVDATSMEAGIALARWFGHEAKRLFGDLAETGEERERRKLVELIRRKGGSITARDLQRASRRYPTAAEAEESLRMLAKAGKGDWHYEGPRAVGVFRLADTADADTYPQKPKENVASVGCRRVGGDKNGNGQPPDQPAMAENEGGAV